MTCEVPQPDRLRATLCLSLMLLLGGPGAALAQRRAEPTDKRTMHAVRIERSLTVDGRLDEPEWQLARPATDFVQKEPHDGRPATERTEVRILFSRTTLYIGVVCYDSEPGRILIADLVEDHATAQEDAIAILIDGFNDGLTDVQLETNPAGSRSDIQHAGNGTISNRDWDAIWYVKTSRRADAWVAEFAIPFKSLRFGNAVEQIWGINFRRRIRRKNEEDVWNPIPRSQNFWTPSLAGRLEGLAALDHGRSLYLKPFAVGGVNAFRSKATTLSRDGGIDVKYGITNGLTLDATYRTDFAQVEVDQQQVNLTRFSLFFPEKREFFLENAGIFSFAGQSSTVGGGGGFGSGSAGAVARPAPFGSNDFILFFSRRIGLSPAGRPIPIEGGARVTGRVPGRIDLGVLSMASDAAPGVPAATYSVAKVRMGLLRNSDIGAMFIDREAGRDFNRVVGLEQNLRFRSNVLNVNSFWARTFSPQVATRDQAWGVSTSWRDRTKSAGAFYREIQANFNNEVGFVRRKDMCEARLDLGLFLRPGRQEGRLRHVREVSPKFEFDYTMSGTNRLVTRTVSPSLDVLFQNGSKLSVTREGTLDRVERRFTIGPGVVIPIGEYRFDETRVEYSGDESRRIAGRASLTAGDFYGGSRRGLGGGVLIRPSYHFSIRGDYSRDAVDLPWRSFVTTLGLLTANLAFTPDLNLNTIVQYASDNRQVLTNVRFRYNYRPWNDFFIVYDETRDVYGRRKKDRALTLKLTYALSL